LVKTTFGLVQLPPPGREHGSSMPIAGGREIGPTQ